jgi:hypothetical protein
MPSEVNEAIMALLNNDIAWDDFSNDIVDCLKSNLASTKYELKGRRMDYESKSYPMNLDFCRIRSEGVFVTKSQTTKLRATIIVCECIHLPLAQISHSWNASTRDTAALSSDGPGRELYSKRKDSGGYFVLCFRLLHLAQAARKEATRCTGNIKLHLHYFSDVASIEKIPGSIAPQAPNLPTGKVDRIVFQHTED